MIIATELLVLIGIEAAPHSLTKQLSSQLLEEVNNMRHSVHDLDDVASETVAIVKDRQKRSSSPYHDYTHTVFELRKNWKPNKCKGIFNCESISPHHCSGSTAKMFCAESEGKKLNYEQ